MLKNVYVEGEAELLVSNSTMSWRKKHLIRRFVQEFLIAEMGD